MYCDIIKTNHRARCMFISSWAQLWITYEAITKSRERGYELFIIDSEKQIAQIVKQRKEHFLILDKE